MANHHGPRKKRPCHHFALGRCRYGDQCTFSHDPQEISKASSEFIDWNSRLHLRRPLGLAADKLFRTALNLLSADASTRQEVIASLAHDKGLEKNKEVLETPWSRFTDERLLKRYTSVGCPLLQIVTDQRVLNSGILEGRLQVIYHLMFGIGGSRSVAFLSAVTRALQYSCESAADSDDDQAKQNIPHLITLSAAFALFVKINQNAKHIPEYTTIFDDIVGLSEFSQFHATIAQLNSIRKNLTDASLHLEHGQDIPFLSKSVKQTAIATEDPAFRLYRAGPGFLNNNARPRHDNDHEDIEHIQILPTFDEINSPLPEYLPLLDPQTWHKDGLAGLVDRCFRLLREDTVGQLRDRVREELLRLNRPIDRDDPNVDSNHASAGRHWHFANVAVQSPFFDPVMGLEVIATFDQPAHIRDLNQQDRRSHWERSRRLQADSVVCLLTPQGSRGRILFCNVINDPATLDLHASVKKQNELHGNARPDRICLSLWSDPNQASLALRPIDMDMSHIESMAYLDALNMYAGQSILVEFPGVLLQAFMPTLQGLKNISLTLDTPFAEYLAPVSATRASVEQVPPPLFASEDGFTYDLKPVCHEDLSMTLIQIIQKARML